jgi:hypothetical protein
VSTPEQTLSWTVSETAEATGILRTSVCAEGKVSAINNSFSKRCNIQDLWNQVIGAYHNTECGRNN